MGEAYFLWKEIDSRDKGVVVDSYPPFVRPKMRVEKVTVPGRAGALTLTEGDEAYDEVQKPCKCTAAEGADLGVLLAWLTGGGTVVFGNDAAYAWDARIDEDFDLTKIMRENPDREFEIPFVCQPFKRLASPGADIELVASGGSVTNPGTVASRPIIRVEGSGGIVVSVGTQMVELTEVDGGIVIDSGMQDAYNLTATELLNENMSGDFPLLLPGANVITWTGTVTKVTITPRWRWI